MIYFSKMLENKAFEFQLERTDKEYRDFSFNCGFSRKCDHAGFNFYWSFWYGLIDISFYDTRHWDADKNRYKTYDKAGNET